MTTLTRKNIWEWLEEYSPFLYSVLKEYFDEYVSGEGRIGRFERELCDVFNRLSKEK